MEKIPSQLLLVTWDWVHEKLKRKRLNQKIKRIQGFKKPSKNLTETTSCKMTAKHNSYASQSSEM